MQRIRGSNGRSRSERSEVSNPTGAVGLTPDGASRSCESAADARRVGSRPSCWTSRLLGDGVVGPRRGGTARYDRAVGVHEANGDDFHGIDIFDSAAPAGAQCRSQLRMCGEFLHSGRDVSWVSQARQQSGTSVRQHFSIRCDVAGDARNSMAHGLKERVRDAFMSGHLDHRVGPLVLSTHGSTVEGVTAAKNLMPSSVLTPRASDVGAVTNTLTSTMVSFATASA